MIAEISSLLGNFFINTIFGNVILTGLFVLLFFVVFGVVLRLSLDAIVVIILPLLWLLSEYNMLGSFGSAIKPLLLIGSGIIIGLALIRLITR
jgi:hypothetical protein